MASQATAPSIEALTRIIAKDPQNPKYYGQRCTALLVAGDFALALKDAKTLVKTLPDAPVGYLKAARCYRYLKKWKAAQTMLDIATEKADESTVKAIRTEARKLENDMLQPKPCFVHLLPEELFVEAISYLSPEEVIKATHVCQGWRRALLRQPKLWKTLHLIVGDKYAVAISNRTADKTTLKIQAYKDRLNGVSLKELSIYGSAKVPAQIRLQASTDHHRQLQKYGMLDNLEAFSVKNIPSRLVFEDFYQHPHSLRFVHWHAGPCPAFEGYRLTDVLARLPLLESVEVLESGSFVNDVSSKRHIFPALSNRSLALSPAPSPSQLPSTSPSPSDVLSPHERLKYLHASASAFFNENSDDEAKSNYSNLEHLHIANVPFITENPLSNVRTLSLRNTCWSIPAGSAFDRLHELRIFGGCIRRDVQSLINEMAAPNLKILTIQTAITNPARLLDFFERSPLIEELYISHVELPNLSQIVQRLPRLSKLQIARSQLPADLLQTIATYNSKLVYLDVSNSANLLSGPLVRMIQALNGTLVHLNIDGCRELEKDAVDWIKKSVPNVVWTGWRDKSEPKGWKLN